MCDIVNNTHSSATKFVPEWYKAQKMCDFNNLLNIENKFINLLKSLNKCFLAFFSIPSHHKTQKVCGRIIFDDPFSSRYVPDQYKTHQKYDNAVDDCLVALKFVSGLFITSKIIKILFSAFYAGEDNEDSGNVLHFCNGMGILYIDLNNINLDGTIHDEDDPDTTILVRLWLLA